MRAPTGAHRRSARVEYLFPQDMAAARQARRLARAFLAGRGHPWAPPSASQVADAELVVSELVTNAVRHGDGDCRLRVAVSDRQVCIEVSDGSSALPRVRPLTAHGESGRGLAMVRHAAQRVDVMPTVGGGKTVRAVLAD
ncbi:ATP-binding protein [Streptomyces sp. 15-116A]|uniref:ATP-binding protein n=1 Tax=Streptomyces sp. 15-116A TaxID=2259035 RepID=UPI0021B4B364|nr:ATP-binding protein [Streptomyces sp. 15-116A]MCT7354715.1 ATP-binding protein [Streptomyces sp. 15-116A]